jgi:hypothetical protein
MYLEEKEMVSRFVRHHAAIIGYTSPMRFINQTDHTPLSFIDPVTQKRLEKEMKYIPIRVWWDVKSHKVRDFDGRNRSYFLYKHGYRSVRIVIFYLTYNRMRPVDISTLSDEDYMEPIKIFGVHSVGVVRRPLEVTSYQRIK